MDRHIKKLSFSILVTALLTVMTTTSVYAAFIREPEVQNPTPNSIDFKWRLNNGALLTIKYGTTTSYGQQVIAINSTTAKLTGLATNTKYYYQILDGTTALTPAGNTTYYFQTAPTPGSNTPFKFAIWGDSGNNSSNQIRVAAQVELNRPQFAVVVGDIIYDYSTDPEYNDKYHFDIYKKTMYNTPFYAVCGNHDSRTTICPDIVMTDHSLPQGGFAAGAAWPSTFSFDYANVHFTSLNSNLSYTYSSSTVNDPSTQIYWAYRDLKNSTQPWKILMFHHSGYSSGSHGTDNSVNNNLVKLAHDVGADFVIWGHSHVFERFESPTIKPIMYTIGNGGQTYTTTCETNVLPCAAHSADNEAGFLLGEINGGTFTMKYINENGSNTDTRTLTKSITGTNPTATPIPSTTTTPTSTPAIVPPTSTPTITPTKVPTPTATRAPTSSPTLTPTTSVATPTPTIPSTPGGTQSYTFQEVSTDFLNPERGFYQDETLSASNSLSSVRSNGSSLVHAYIRLDNYRTSDLTTSFISDLNTGLQNLRNAKLKAIVRFTYNFDTQSPDASETIINRHLAQLSQTFANNKDVLYSLQVGFIGAWGEWWSSTNFQTGRNGNPDSSYGPVDVPTLQRVYTNIINTLAPNNFADLRYPGHKTRFFPNSPINSSTAFNNSTNSRTGFHNDCFLADSNDSGTFDVDGMTVDAVKKYIGNETLYTPMTGETCEQISRVSCTTALAELASMHWSSLNMEFNTAALDVLKNQGCYNEVSRRLGYRFVVNKVTTPSSIATNASFNFTLDITNTGFAPVYYARPVYLVLQNTSTNAIFKVQLSNLDPRRWIPGQSLSLTSTVSTANIPQGIYKASLWLPDSNTSLQSIPEYAIRLASNITWDNNTGYNNLFNLSIGANTGGTTVTPAPTNSPTPINKLGDANADGKVDLLDYAIWKNNYGKIPSTSATLVSQGDFNQDAKIDGIDYATWLSNYQ